MSKHRRCTWSTTHIRNVRNTCGICIETISSNALCARSPQKTSKRTFGFVVQHVNQERSLRRSRFCCLGGLRDDVRLLHTTHWTVNNSLTEPETLVNKCSICAKPPEQRVHNTSHHVEDRTASAIQRNQTSRTALQEAYTYARKVVLPVESKYHLVE